MEKVVYLLGAGFSAPLGLPVIGNFLLRAKDLYFADPKKYGHFKDVLETIDKMQKAKSYYEVDLFNIEEILSILDMQDMVEGQSRSEKFCTFIKDVVQAYTPPISVPPSYEGIPGVFGGKEDHFASHLFGQTGDSWNGYGQFVANLLSLRLDAHLFRKGGPDRRLWSFSALDDPPFEYGVVTLNYDNVLENCVRQLRTYVQPTKDTDLPPLGELRQAKLHGSVDGEIVAPTWKKWTVSGLGQTWHVAYKLLSEANYLRILGYSLPVTDAYVRYLLEASVLRAEHLKQIDIICLDDDRDTVRSRYEQFITFQFKRFQKRDIRDYLRPSGTESHRLFTPRSEAQESGREYRVEFDRLNERHEAFMQGK